MARVLVGCPTSFHKEYCLKEYKEGLKSLTYPKHDVLLVDNSPDDTYARKIKEQGIPVIRWDYNKSPRKRIVDSRNVLRRRVLEGGYDYLFSLEQDVIPPKDVIERLLKHKQKILTGVYFTYATQGNMTKLLPLLYKKTRHPKIQKQMRTEEIYPPRKIIVKSCGLGCVLIHRDVLEKVKFRYDKEYAAFDDMFFCRDAEEHGFKIVADTSLKCKHMIDNWDWSKVQ